MIVRMETEDRSTVKICTMVGFTPMGHMMVICDDMQEHVLKVTTDEIPGAIHVVPLTDDYVHSVGQIVCGCGVKREVVDSRGVLITHQTLTEDYHGEWGVAQAAHHGQQTMEEEL